MKHRKNKVLLFGAVFLMSLILMGRGNLVSALNPKGAIMIDYHVTVEDNRIVRPFGVPFAIYQVGYFRDGTVVLNEDFQASGVSVEDPTASARNHQAKQLYAYATQHAIAGTTAETKNGEIEYTELDVGVYLIVQMKPYKTETMVYDSEPFLLSVPLETDGGWDFHVRVEPKTAGTPIQLPVPPTPPEAPAITDTSPKTGDSTHLLRLLGIALSSASGLAILKQFGCKKEHDGIEPSELRT